MVKAIKRTSYTPTPVTAVVGRSSKLAKYFVFGDIWKAENKKVFKRMVNRHTRRKDKMNLVNNLVMESI